MFLASHSSVSPQSYRADRITGHSLDETLNSPAHGRPTVLRRSIAIVIGPTPPGTGVRTAGPVDDGVEVHVAGEAVVEAVHPHVDHRRPRLDQVGARRGADRPPRRSGRRRAGRRRRRSRVREWQTVTVALRSSRSDATGLPTRIERPTTTASAPSSSTSGRRSSSITPAGVQGRSPGCPWARRPALIGVRPSTSLAGAIRADEHGLVEVLGHRQLEQDPAHGSSALSASISAATCSRLGHVRRRAVVEGLDADLRAGLLLHPHVDRRRGVVSDEHRGQARAARRGPPRAPRRRGHLLAHPRGHGLAVDDVALMLAA